MLYVVIVGLAQRGIHWSDFPAAWLAIKDLALKIWDFIGWLRGKLGNDKEPKAQESPE